MEKYANHNITFSLDDTEQLERLDKKVAVVPKVFGYSEDEGREMWPHYEYPDCKTLSRKDRRI